MAPPAYEPGQVITAGVLYRRIPPLPHYYDADERRPTRLAFKLGKGHDHLSMALRDKTSVTEILEGHEGYGLCEIDVDSLVREGLEVRYEPSEAEGPAHVAVRGKFTDSVRHRLARAARVVVDPGS